MTVGYSHTKNSGYNLSGEGREVEGLKIGGAEARAANQGPKGGWGSEWFT